MPKTRKTIRRATKTRKTTKLPEPTGVYSGPPIPATKVFCRKMPEFKKCTAEMWMLLNENDRTVTYANTYNGLLKASYDATHYTFQAKEIVVARKQKDMQEVEVTDWPEWIVNTRGRKRRSRAAS